MQYLICVFVQRIQLFFSIGVLRTSWAQRRLWIGRLSKWDRSRRFGVCRVFVISEGFLCVPGADGSDPALRLAEIWSKAKLEIVRTTLLTCRLQDSAQHLLFSLCLEVGHFYALCLTKSTEKSICFYFWRTPSSRRTPIFVDSYFWIIY